MANPESDTGTPAGTDAPGSAPAGIESLVGAEFDKAETQPDTATSEPEQPPARSDTEVKSDDPPKRLWAGKYQSPEEMEAGYLEAQRKMHEATEAAAKKADDGKKGEDEELVSLSDAELAELKRADPEAYEEYTFETLRRKREAKANAEKATEDKVSKLVDEKLKPFDETRKELEVKKWAEREESVHTETKRMFESDFEALDKQRRDVNFIQKVLETSPIGKMIVAVNKESPATAHQLLLREIQIFNYRSNQDKARRSIPADAGNPASPKPIKEKMGGSIEECVDFAIEELKTK